MKPIYKPKGKAKEYGDYALNIYTGCNHGCTYCYAEGMAKRFGKDFSIVEPRKGIIEAVKNQINREGIRDKLIHLCFTCDPYPADIDTGATRAVIRVIKSYGNHVQILTKGGMRAERDFDLLDSEDWFGITYSGYESVFMPAETEPNAASPSERLASLSRAHKLGLKTWISMEPVMNEHDITSFLDLNVWYVDRYKIGKLNYHPSDINWGEFGCKCERICRSWGYDYYIKEDLRKEMEALNEPNNT